MRDDENTCPFCGKERTSSGGGKAESLSMPAYGPPPAHLRNAEARSVTLYGAPPPIDAAGAPRARAARPLVILVLIALGAAVVYLLTGGR